MQPVGLAVVSAPHEFDTFLILVREYVDSLGFPLTFQDLDREIAEVRTEYGPPAGRAWIATAGDEPAGAVGLRRFAPDAAEIKRMFVRPAHRGRGIGRMLAQAAVDAAREIGYRRVLLDTVASMTGAIGIYRSLGFTEIEPYRHNPRADAVYMGLDLPNT